MTQTCFNERISGIDSRLKMVNKMSSGRAMSRHPPGPLDSIFRSIANDGIEFGNREMQSEIEQQIQVQSTD
jgi:hypothetical protein